MISNILPFVALAGVAMASCPLSVSISGTTDHVAYVAIKNTGNVTLTVFKGNTVLSPHATKDLLAVDADGKALPFQGAYVTYRRTGLNPEMFQVILPGQTITSSVNAARTYKLSGVPTAKITAIQGFKYVTGSAIPTSLKDTLVCESVTSGAVAIAPDQKKAAKELFSKHGQPFSSRIKKRAVTYNSCTSAQTTSLKTSFTDAVSLASAAYTAAGTAAYYFTVWFKSTSQQTKVRSIYTAVKAVQTTSPAVYCVDNYGVCADGEALLYAVPSDNVITPCPSNGYWSFPEYATTCANSDYDRAGSILHEITHLSGTEDYAYGPADAKALSATQASNNADTYEMYAGSVRLGGCN